MLANWLNGDRKDKGKKDVIGTMFINISFEHNSALHISLLSKCIIWECC